MDKLDKIIIGFCVFIVLAVVTTIFIVAKEYGERQPEALLPIPAKMHMLTQCPACHMPIPKPHNCGHLSGDAWADCMDKVYE